MSASSPGARRRRIAGERKTARPRPESPDPAPEQTRSRSGAAVDAPAAPAEPAAPGRPSGSAGATTETPAVTADEPTAPRRAVPGRLLAGAMLAAVLLLLAAGAVAVLVPGAGWDDWQDLREQERVDAALRTAPAAAERAAETILAYDHRSIEADRDAAAATMTPDYRKEYLETFDGLVIEEAKEQRARVEADVRASGVSVPGADRVEVLLFVNQTSLSKADSGEPRTALNRVAVTMQRVGDRWLVDDITSY